MPSLALGTAAGAGVGIDKILERLMTEERLRQQQSSLDETTRSNKAREKIQNDNLMEQTEYRKQMHSDAMQQRNFSQGLQTQQFAERINEATPAGPMDPANPSVPFLRSIGAGQDVPAIDPLGAMTEGPLQVDETREGGRPAKFLKSATANQLERESSRKDKDTDNARQASMLERQVSADAEAKRHNQAMEARPPMGSVAVIQGPSGPMVVDKPSGTAKPVTSAGGETVGPAPTQLQRNTQQQYNKARPVLSAISDLSEKINTNQGLYAKAVGGASKLAAKANLDDDVAEYESMISGFTPLIARALGHTGVLTEQDVQSVKALFPRPGDGKSLRDRKVARIEQLMGAIEGKSPDAPAAPTAADLIKKYRNQ